MFRHETTEEAVSMLFNWLTGHSITEMYCARCYRENKITQMLIINWIYFLLTRRNDIGHCERVYQGGTKRFT
jgi:hypothetical protein